jgi:hypothetical protein
VISTERVDHLHLLEILLRQRHVLALLVLESFDDLGSRNLLLTASAILRYLIGAEVALAELLEADLLLTGRGVDETGMKTRPKLMLPFQIARIAANVSKANGDLSCVQVSTSRTAAPGELRLRAALSGTLDSGLRPKPQRARRFCCGHFGDLRERADLREMPAIPHARRSSATLDGSGTGVTRRSMLPGVVVMICPVKPAGMSPKISPLFVKAPV